MSLEDAQTSKSAPRVQGQIIIFSYQFEGPEAEIIMHPDSSKSPDLLQARESYSSRYELITIFRRCNAPKADVSGIEKLVPKQYLIRTTKKGPAQCSQQTVNRN